MFQVSKCNAGHRPPELLIIRNGVIRKSGGTISGFYALCNIRSCVQCQQSFARQAMP